VNEAPTYRYGMDIDGRVYWTVASTPMYVPPTGDGWEFVGVSADGTMWYWQRGSKMVLERGTSP